MRSPAEKIIAMGATYRALRTELPGADTSDPMIQSALINAALIIAMSTDTRSLGILGTDDPGPRAQVPGQTAMEEFIDADGLDVD